MTDINILCVSHNSRIRCFLSKLFGNKKMLAFKNCAILKISINLSNIYNIELFSAGEIGDDISHPESYFYDQNTFDRIHKIIHPTKSRNMIIYLVRHAEGEHNPKKNKYKSWINRLTSILGISSLIDPPLSVRGIKQAKSAGNILREIKFNHVFTSELRRTRETAHYILSNSVLSNSVLSNSVLSNSVLPVNHVIYPIPCIHEISKYDKGRCDELRFNINLISAPENKTNCYKLNMQQTDECKNFNTDWSIYNKLIYTKCSKTNLIQNIIFAINVSNL